MVESAAPCRFWFSDESSLLTPLIWNVAPRVPVPLKLIDEPDDAVGLFCPLVGIVLEAGEGLRQRQEAARAERRLVHDLLGGERSLDLGVGQVDRRRGGGDGDVLRDARIELDVDDARVVQADVDALRG